jgi:hypothetical protein
LPHAALSCRTAGEAHLAYVCTAIDASDCAVARAVALRWRRQARSASPRARAPHLPSPGAPAQPHEPGASRPGLGAHVERGHCAGHELSPPALLPGMHHTQSHVTGSAILVLTGLCLAYDVVAWHVERSVQRTVATRHAPRPCSPDSSTSCKCAASEQGSNAHRSDLVAVPCELEGVLQLRL